MQSNFVMMPYLAEHDIKKNVYMNTSILSPQQQSQLKHELTLNMK